MSSDPVLELCRSYPTITSNLAQNPHSDIKSIEKQLYHKSVVAKTETVEKKFRLKDEFTKEELDRAEKCGKFPYRPSDLFLKMYSESLKCFETDPLIGMVSPPLLASSGVIPLSIISVIPDIMRHYANLIEHAETEVFLATNYWEPSHSATLVTSALKTLSRKVGERKGEKVVVKLMYDRGTPKQVVTNHAKVEPKDWGKVDIPAPEEIPNLQLEVMNYHRPIVGTFHAKYLVVDRRIALINSNNCQDRPNLEMCVHLEGPIVDSFYDMALISWRETMDPPLPMLTTPRDHGEYKFKQDNEHIKHIDTAQASRDARSQLGRHHEAMSPSEQPSQGDLRPPPTTGQEHSSADSKGMKESDFKSQSGEKVVTDQVDQKPVVDDFQKEHPNESVSADSGAKKATTNHNPLADKLQSESAPSGAPQSNAPTAAETSPDPVSSASVPPHVTDGSESTNAIETKDQDDEIKGAQKQFGKMEGIARHLNAGASELQATAQESDDTEEFRPHILHDPHDPVPIAMVNRPPRGTPGHGDVNVPQNIAWLAGMRFAKKSVFIQSPTFNATPVVAEALATVRRGVTVTIYVSLGYNDQGEMIPFQGGTNEEVVENMYKELVKEGKGHEKNLKVYWYTGKDQNVPLNAAAKSRNCHVKFFQVDDQVAVFGNGNQDTQSWFHSQEINVMVDSPQLVAEWMAAIKSNQNTHLYGFIDQKDGVWKDKQGKPSLQGTGKGGKGILGRLGGLFGAVQRVRGEGGF